jgi:hypothetical protein
LAIVLVLAIAFFREHLSIFAQLSVSYFFILLLWAPILLTRPSVGFIMPFITFYYLIFSLSLTSTF